MYNDACGWNDDPASAGYRTCAGSGKAGGNITMSVTVQVIGTGSTTLAGAIYDFSGSSYHYNADFGNNALPVTAIAGAADLSITKTDSVASVSAGGTTTYTIVVRNAGPSAADGAIVSDPAVSGLTKTSVSCSAAGGAACPATVTVAGLESGLAIPALPSGGTVTFTVSALVTATTGSIVNTAIVAAPAGTTDPNPANNTATDTDTVTTAGRSGRSRRDEDGWCVDAESWLHDDLHRHRQQQRSRCRHERDPDRYRAGRPDFRRMDLHRIRQGRSARPQAREMSARS